jgi:hypothetical protein
MQCDGMVVCTFSAQEAKAIKIVFAVMATYYILYCRRVYGGDSIEFDSSLCLFGCVLIHILRLFTFKRGWRLASQGGSRLTQAFSLLKFTPRLISARNLWYDYDAGENYWRLVVLAATKRGARRMQNSISIGSGDLD